MKKNQGLLAALLITGILVWIFMMMMPQWISSDDAPLSEFSVKRATAHVSKIAESPHYVGTPQHSKVAEYLIQELKNLGLEPTVQEGTSLTEWGNLVKSKNILTRIDGSGSGKALMLLSHYDSAPHSSAKGAADNAAGVAAVLETVRTFLHNKTPHQNDIIILFSDAEELGLNGAALFVTQHGWAKEVGFVLNCEARGSSGPAYMLMETNKGNAALVREFSAAGTKFPVASSLMYSIYKMLPNDTDLTVFREKGQIQGFNFAFIDSHYNYHTAQDDIEHLDHRSLAHHGSYLMPLLAHLSNANLSQLDSPDDYVYFNTPINFMSYPFSWIFPMLIVAVVLFVFLVFIGIGKRTLVPGEIAKGFSYLFGALILSGLIAFFGWKALLSIYPQYRDIAQGFTYNGHAYLLGFIFLTLAICFFFYARTKMETLIFSHTIAPILLWIIIASLTGIYLPGAAFFIIPVFCCIFMLGYFVVTQKSNLLFNLLFAIPSLVLMAPLVWMLPIGLGLKLIFASAVLSVLLFGILLPVFGAFSQKGVWSVLMLLISIGFFVKAHLNSGYEPGKAKPNSLVYFYDADRNLARWATYDLAIDEWTKGYLGENPGDAALLNTTPLFSKYDKNFTYSAEAPMKALEKPTVEFLFDSIMGNQRYLTIKISPKRKVNRYDIFANEKLDFHNLKANGVYHTNKKGSKYIRNGKKILSYYVVNNEPLELQFSIAKDKILDMEFLESSFDLTTNPLFSIAKRADWMMPMPFILNDAVIVKQKIRPAPKVAAIIPIQQIPAIVTDTIPSADDGNGIQ